MGSDLLYLIHAAQAGNPDAMLLLLDRHRPMIESLAARFAAIRPCGAYPDLRQDACLAFIRAVHDFRVERGEFGALAYTAVRNGCFTALPRYLTPLSMGRRGTSFSLLPARASDAALTGPALDSLFTALFVGELVRTLPQTERELIARTYGLGGRSSLPATQAGRSLGLTPRTARRRHQQALARMREQLREERA